MNLTPKISKSSSKNNFSTPNKNLPTSILDPKMFSEMDNDDSPMHIASTQEGCDNVDVVWDWNSPQAKQPRRSKKRLILSQSPKVLKRHPSNNNIQNFEKLREELQALREAIAVPDNEESLVLSPVEEAEYKTVEDQNLNNVPPLTQEHDLEGNEDLFNDSADEYLLLCTQKLEANLESKKENMNGCNSNLVNTITSEDVNVNTSVNRNIDVNLNLQQTENFNSEPNDNTVFSRKTNDKDKLEANKFMGSRINSDSGRNNSTYLSFTRTKSEEQYKYSKQPRKVEFHRTESFESTVEYTNEVIPQHKLDEIERKRREALAKLESKRKQEYNYSKCSPEEIEQKRLQALAKLEAKRLQEIIERKRQEAVKRLELSRQKKAVVVKSSLSKRL